MYLHHSRFVAVLPFQLRVICPKLMVFVLATHVLSLQSFARPISHSGADGLAVPMAHGSATEDSQSQILAFTFEEPLIAIGPTFSKETQAMVDAIQAYQHQTVPDDFHLLEAFLSSYPESAWRVALLTNLGLAYYHFGYFSKAIAAWEGAWQAGRSVSEPRARALVDRAVGELIRMHARLGHADQVAALLKDTEAEE